LAQQWFLGDEFGKLKQKIEPTDYSEYLKEQKNKGKKGEN
jgi:hypothetical protein